MSVTTPTTTADAPRGRSLAQDAFKRFFRHPTGMVGLFIGPVLMAATVVLSLGMAVTMFSSLPMIRLFGSLCVVVLLTALAVALIVLPALISVVSRRYPDL